MKILLAALFALGFSGAAHGRGLSTPSVHWGSIEFPLLENSGTMGFSLIQFSEFDKKIDPATGDHLRYNDIDETFGFNLLSFSRTRQLRSGDEHRSNLFFTSSLAIGASIDATTSYYQNDILHELKDLPHVPRDGEDRGMILAYGGELNYRLLQLTRDRRGDSRLSDTPLFLGAGYSVGTILQDVYVHAGILRLRYPQQGRRNRIAHVDFSAMARVGVLETGFDFEELAQSYWLTQAGVGLTVMPYYFPIRFEFAMMGHSGIFLESRQLYAANGYGDEEDLRNSLHERFYSFRVGIGSWTFETFNEAVSPNVDDPSNSGEWGKDRGPTYGARMWITTYPGEKWFQRMFALFGRLL